MQGFGGVGGRLPEGFGDVQSAHSLCLLILIQPKRKILSSFKQKPRACVPHTHYAEIGNFMRATAC